MGAQTFVCGGICLVLQIVLEETKHLLPRLRYDYDMIILRKCLVNEFGYHFEP